MALTMETDRFKNLWTLLEEHFDEERSMLYARRVYKTLFDEHGFRPDTFEAVVDHILHDYEPFHRFPKIGVFVDECQRWERRQRFQEQRRRKLAEHEEEKKRIEAEGRRKLSSGEVDPRLVEMARHGNLLTSVADSFNDEEDDDGR